jgi:hypothetical protein
MTLEHRGVATTIWLNDIYEAMWHTFFDLVKAKNSYNLAAVVTYAPPGWSKSARAQAAARIERQLASFAEYICEDPQKLPPIYFVPEPVAAAVSASAGHLEAGEAARVMTVDMGEEQLLVCYTTCLMGLRHL